MPLCAFILLLYIHLYHVHLLMLVAIYYDIVPDLSDLSILTSLLHCAWANVSFVAGHTAGPGGLGWLRYTPQPPTRFRLPFQEPGPAVLGYVLNMSVVNYKMLGYLILTHLSLSSIEELAEYPGVTCHNYPQIICTIQYKTFLNTHQCIMHYHIATIFKILVSPTKITWSDL